MVAGESARPVIEAPWLQLASECQRFGHPPLPINSWNGDGSWTPRALAGGDGGGGGAGGVIGRASNQGVPTRRTQPLTATRLVGLPARPPACLSAVNTVSYWVAVGDQTAGTRWRAATTARQ
eukprot:SAG25_NODE_852_length_5073_cov_31.793727_1_plen_122_part_00